MKVLYISSVPSSSEFSRMKNFERKSVNITKYGMDEAGFKFHSLIQSGLADDTSNEIYSLIGRGTSIKTYKGVFWRTRKDKSNNIFYIHLGYFNIPIIKHIGLAFSFLFNTLVWLIKNKNEKEKFIIIDAAYISAVPFVLLAKKLFACKTLAIFCDIYEYMANVEDARMKKSRIKGLIGKIMRIVYRNIDAFILLTEEMNKVVNLYSKPYTIIEGLVDVNMRNVDNTFENKSIDDVIMYAGALRKQYGLENLINGFIDYKNDNARLWIYGAGDYSEDIALASKRDKRILFYGQKDLQTVVDKELEATLLINPRPTNHEFTRYSFPSKNMEYMVSGTPILTTKLPGMPKEYYHYVFTIEGNDSQDVTMALKKVFSNSKEKLHERGQIAKKFVLENKNNIVQTRKIIDLYNSIE